jgi:putative phosphoserine phosphatase/1-acylglycerol-3-phosphate O-acyltransferase
MSTTLRLPGSVAEVAASPEGPEIGAFFDLDGTLIAGYSARHLTQDRLRNREVGLGELLRTVGLAVGAGVGRADFEDLLRLGAESWRGRAHEDLDEMGQRLFQRRIEPLIYPEMRELVRAHQRRGHTVVLSSSATSYQVEPVAQFLGIDEIVCNRFTVKDGVLTGDVETPVLWGPGKAVAVQRLAAARNIDLAGSYFYADGDEDLALMYLVGHPRPTNPGRKLDRVATSRGWPVLRFNSRSGGSMGARVRTVAGLASVIPVGVAAAGLGLAKRDKHAALNFTTARWLDLLFAINGVKLEVAGREHLWEQRPAVFIFNHRNNFDAFVAVRLVEKNFSGVAKKELENNFIIGTFGKLADVAFVDRSNSAAAVKALQPVQELAKKGLSIMAAPEGTRLDTTEVGPFKKGAFRMAMAAEIPIVPIVIHNAELIGSRDATMMNAGTVNVTVLPPISVKDWKLEQLNNRIAEVRQLFLDSLREGFRPEDAA